MKLYVKVWCPWCVAAREWLDTRGFKYQLVDVEANRADYDAMIKLSGQEPDVDIAIEIVGPRPGEKLHEDLFNPNELKQPTTAEKIMLAEREPVDPAAADAMFDEIALLVLEGDAAGLAARVSALSAGAPVSPDAGEAPAVRPVP